MTTLKEIQEEIVNKKQIVINLGYNNLEIGLKTLNSLLNSKSIIDWLNKSHYDYKYSSHEFLHYLFLLLGFNDIKEILDYSNFIKSLKEPQIIIKTNFKRKNEPIIVLGCLSSLLRIKLNKLDIINLTFKEEKELIYKKINNHFKENNGKLKLFGEIISYTYYSEIYKREIIVYV